MADRVSLEVLGFILGGVTAIVMLIAAIVVRHHVEQRLTLEASSPVVPISLTRQAR